MSKVKFRHEFIIIAALLFIISLIIRVQLKQTYFNLNVFFLLLFFSIIVVFYSVDTFKSIKNRKSKFSLYRTKLGLYSFGIATLFFGTYILYTITIQRSKDFSSLKNQKYKQLSGIIVNHPEVRSARYHKSVIYIDNYPGFGFSFRSMTLSKNNRMQFNNQVSKGDSIYLQIRLRDYERKITKNKSLSFSDKHFDYDKIDIYDLEIDKIKYISKENAIKEWKHYTFGYWIALLVSISCIIVGILILITTKK